MPSVSLSGNTDEPVAEVTFDGVTTTPSYVVSDPLGSTAVMLNAAGTVTDRFFHQPFGMRINADGTAFSGVLGPMKNGFTGQESDDAFGLINFKGRMYDPALKRFISADPHVTFPGFGQSWNPYSYVLNSPLSFTDPSGLDTFICNSGGACYLSSGNGSGSNDSGSNGNGSIDGDKASDYWSSGPFGTAPTGSAGESSQGGGGRDVAKSDGSGSQPGDQIASGLVCTGTSGPCGSNGFLTAWEAAHAALSKYNPLSIQSVDKSSVSSTGVEYGGLIYRVGKLYFFAEAVTDTEEGTVDVWSALKNVPEGARRSIVGDFHTHGGPNAWAPGESFSGFEPSAKVEEIGGGRVRINPGLVLPSTQSSGGDLNETRADLISRRGNIIDPTTYTAFLGTPEGRFGLFIPYINGVFTFSPNRGLLPAGAEVPAMSYAH